MIKRIKKRYKLIKVYEEIISITHIRYKLHDLYFKDREVFIRYMMKKNGSLIIYVPDNSQINILRSNTLMVFINNIMDKYGLDINTYRCYIDEVPKVPYDKSQMILSIFVREVNK